jgi:putative nonproteinogenic amino acid hydroxylase
VKSQRLATIPIDSYDLTAELGIVDDTPVNAMYDAMTLGSWTSYILANDTGAQQDAEFRPHGGTLQLTDLGERLPEVMRLVRTHFDTTHLQWVRIFGLQDGILAPHRDFLEFEKPGTRIQVPLRTSLSSLHSEDDVVYHLRRGEVWRIHTVDTHAAYSAGGPARLSLCLDFAGDHFDPETDIYQAVAAAEPEHIVRRKPLAQAGVAGLIDGAARTLTPQAMRDTFRRFAELHFAYEASATDVHDWFIETARRSGDASLLAKARAFKVFCVEARAYGERFAWS